MAKPDGPLAAVLLAAGIGAFALGLFTTLAEASAGFRDRLVLNAGVGPLSGKTVWATVIFIVAWAVLARSPAEPGWAAALGHHHLRGADGARIARHVSDLLPGIRPGVVRQAALGGVSTDRVTLYALAYGDEQIERRAVRPRLSHCASYSPTLAARQGLLGRQQSLSLRSYVRATRYCRKVNIATYLRKR